MACADHLRQVPHWPSAVRKWLIEDTTDVGGDRIPCCWIAGVRMNESHCSENITRFYRSHVSLTQLWHAGSETCYLVVHIA